MIAGRFLSTREGLLTLRPAGTNLIWEVEAVHDTEVAGSGTIALAQINVVGMPQNWQVTQKYPCAVIARCEFEDLGLTALDFLAFQPMAIDTDGDNTDKLLLIGSRKDLPFLIAVLINTTRSESFHDLTAFVLPSRLLDDPTASDFIRIDPRFQPTEAVSTEDLEVERLAYDGRALKVDLSHSLPGTQGESMSILGQSPVGLTLRGLGFLHDEQTGQAHSALLARAAISDDRGPEERGEGQSANCSEWMDGQGFSRLHYEPIAYKNTVASESRLALVHRPRAQTRLKNVFLDEDPFAADPTPFEQADVALWPSQPFAAVKELPPAFGPRALIEGVDHLRVETLALDDFPWHFIQGGGAS